MARKGFVKIDTLIKWVDANVIGSIANSLGATRHDTLSADPGLGRYAVAAQARLVLSGTTTRTLDIGNLAAADAHAGDTTFATVSQIQLANDGTQPLSILTGGTNPLDIPFTSLALAAGDHVVLRFASPRPVDPSHKTIDVTPTTGGSIVITLEGA